MTEKQILRMAHLLSGLFRPFYLPLVGLAALFLFSTLSILPFMYKAMVLLVVWFGTVLMPTMLITAYHRYHGWTLFQLTQKERRVVPYAISIVCYFCCYYILVEAHTPHAMGAIVMAALIVQIVCALINIRWKISTHTAAIGSFLGGLIAFSMIFLFNPVGWFCVVTLIGGVVGTNRMILRQHTLGEVVGGYCVGFVFSLFTVLLV